KAVTKETPASLFCRNWLCEKLFSSLSNNVASRVSNSTRNNRANEDSNTATTGS
ncbi:hypothetical protein SUGI_1307170, partial [Cryptomeria japonica]